MMSLSLGVLVSVSLQSAVCSLQSAVCSLWSAVCSLQSVVCSLQMSDTGYFPSLVHISLLLLLLAMVSSNFKIIK